MARHLLRVQGMIMRAENDTHSSRQGLLGTFPALGHIATPLMRGVKSRYGLALEENPRGYPGDELVRNSTSLWTHVVDIDASAASVWPWIVQVGQDKAGFYSYDWLERLAGCQVRNSTIVEAAWQNLAVGDPFKLHAKAPPLTIAAMNPGKWFVVTRAPDGDGSGDREPGARASWLLLVEPTGPRKCRLVSRLRVAHIARARVDYGAWLSRSVGFVMDRALLLGIKHRAEGRHLIREPE